MGGKDNPPPSVISIVHQHPHQNPILGANLSEPSAYLPIAIQHLGNKHQWRADSGAKSGKSAPIMGCIDAIL
jgi:hypothetical protein